MRLTFLIVLTLTGCGDFVCPEGHRQVGTETCVLGCPDCADGGDVPAESNGCASCPDRCFAGACVGCLQSDQCGAPTAVCDTVDHQCVGCVMDTDCATAGFARCDSVMQVCAACTMSSECAHITGANVCEAGECVECNAAESTACAASETCDLLSSTCSSIAPASLRTCDACTNDAQCPVNHRCLRTQFMGVDRDPGYYCLEEGDAPGDCPNPFATGTVDRMSINGAAAERYCGIEEMLSTCEAVRALLDDLRCDAGVDGRCYPAGMPELTRDIEAALCRDLDGGLATNRCTYGCGGALATCAPNGPGITCGPGSTGGDNYCGG